MKKLDIFVDNDMVKWIPGYENMYAARIDGAIISYKGREPKIMKQSKNDKGYLKVNLSRNSKDIKTMKVHRLIALTFIDNPKPEKYTDIDHIDMNKENNSYINLRWCDYIQNIYYAYKNKYGEHWVPPNKKIMKKIKKQKILFTKYGSIDEMIKQTGKSIIVNKIKFISAGSAASYIVECEKRLGNNRNKNTVSKELRRMIQGKIKYRIMYGKYKIEPV